MGTRSGPRRRRSHLRFRARARARARARVLRARRPAEAEERQTRGRVLEPSRSAAARRAAPHPQLDLAPPCLARARA